LGDPENSRFLRPITNRKERGQWSPRLLFLTPKETHVASSINREGLSIFLKIIESVADHRKQHIFDYFSMLTKAIPDDKKHSGSKA